LQALAEAERLGVRGAETTPFVLKHVAEETGGDSLKANVALVKNNAAVGAAIAVEYARLRRVGGGSH
jgi:pseudouridine-5'-phosphate glycosidase